MENSFYEQFEKDLWTLGNHHNYGLLKDTFEERGNELLKRTKDFLSNNNDIDNELKHKIKCQQYWLVGFMLGQKIKIHETNFIEP